MGSGSLNFFARVFAGECTDTPSKIAVGSGTPSGSGLGSEFTDSGFARATGTIAYVDSDDYPSSLQISKTFTASGADVTISEAALYTDESTPTLIGYVHFTSSDLPNGGLVPDGEDITLVMYLTFSKGSTSVADEDTVSPDFSLNVGVVFSSSTTLDPSGFSCTTGLCYNGRAIRNGNITGITPFKGGRKWDISGVTDDYTDIERLEYYASPTQTGITVMGLQYVNSIMLPGTFKIRESDGTYTSHSNCYISGEISVTPFGIDQWEFSLTIIKAGT